MFNIKRTMAFILAGMMLLLWGCHRNENPSVEGSDTNSSATEPSDTQQALDPENAVILAANGESRYTIIRTDLDSEEGKLAVTLRNAIQNAVGIQLPLKTDYSKNDITEYEIVVGETTRESEVDQLSVPTRGKDWTITQIGNRIYLRGGNYDGTKAAVEYFIANYIFNDTKTVMVPQNVSKNGGGTYAIGELTVEGNSLGLYNIVIPTVTDKSTVYAAEELQAYLNAATGYHLPIVKDNQDTTEYELLVGITNRNTAGVDLSNLGDEGFVVASVGNKILMSGGEDSLHGTLYAVYEFLRSCLGYHFYASDCEVVTPASSIALEDISLRWVPTFDYRQVLWGEVIFNLDLSAKLQISGDWGIGNQHAIYPLADRYIGNNAHTFAELMDVPEPGQPCLCDESNYEKALARVMALLEKDASGQLISVSQNDNHNYCKCDKCKAKEAELGTKADILLSFVNRIAAEVAKKYPDVMIHTFAYDFTIEPPKTVMPADNVLIEFAPLGACWFCSLDDPSCKTNSEYWEYFHGWAKITENIQIWDYTTDFGMYLLPFGNFDVLQKNVALYAKHGVDGIFSQGQYNGGNAGFGVLSNYIISRLLANPSMTEDEYQAEIIGFMKGYYGAAWESVYAYFEAIHELNQSCHSNNGSENAINADGYYERLAELDSLWKAAKAAVKDDALSLKHVELAELQHTYVRLYLTWYERYSKGDSTSKAAYVAENQAFYQALVTANVRLNEGKGILDCGKVNFTVPPQTWH